MAKTRKFYMEFLGLGAVRLVPIAQYVWSGGPWTIVNVQVDELPKEQGIENRFCLAVASPEEVEAAYKAALRDKEKYEMRQVLPIKVEDDTTFATIQDLDGTWWEIYHHPGRYYDEEFNRGDVTATPAV
jgi:hypothetical protein